MELRIALSGFTQPPNMPVSPFAISFNLDTLSGSQTLTFQQGCLQFYNVTGAAVTDFSSTIGTQSIFLASTTGFGGGPDISGTCPGGINNDWLINNSLGFSWFSNTTTSTHDPVAALWMDLNDLNVFITAPNGGGFPLGFFQHFKVTSVPEPATSALMCIGLLAVGIISTLRRRRHC